MGGRTLACPLRPGLLLLLLPQSKQRHTSNLYNLEAHTRNITHSVTGTTETGNKHLVILIDEVKGTIAGHKSSDLLAILDQLDTARLTNSRVRLLGLNSAAQKKVKTSIKCNETSTIKNK